ncbi:MAG: hydantoinase B/oxoprolinase family protein [Dehalococcoidia bacterium]|nr:hydantoinase B/oxoprolinase family protein [Dehalococcoidia bacterium]
MKSTGIRKLEPYLMVVLARKFEAITAEMTNTMLRTARSNVMATARDFGCSIVDDQYGTICVVGGNVNHVAGAHLVAKITAELFHDIKPGDCFLNNSPYYGNPHHGDLTIIVPVFYQEEHLFTTIARAHHADCGNSQPTTYMPFSRDLYEEGALDFPSLRIHRDYKEKKDLIRMCRVRIRVPDQWYGDILAQVAAARTGERRLIELCDKYGADTIKAFVRQWQNYGRQRMIAEIKKLPNGTWEAETSHDPVPGVADNGITVRLKMTIDPNEGHITLDFKDSDDWVPGGYNMSMGSIIPAATTGVFNNIDPTVPHNEGAFSRIKLELRQGSVVGPVVVPICASIATTSVSDRVVNLVQSIFGQLGKDKGIAEGALGMPASASVVAGVDWRTGRPYVNQLILGAFGGPAVYGHDGWITYGIPVVGGTIYFDSVEVNEQKYPLIWEHNELILDSGGAGRWRGAPACSCIVRPRHDPGSWAYSSDGHLSAAKGIQGGLAGSSSSVWKYNIHTKKRVNLTQISFETITPDEAIVSESCGGGGFGDPLERDPEKVVWDVREGFISVEKARDIYGVVVDTSPEQYVVDYKSTEELRRNLKKEKGGKK